MAEKAPAPGKPAIDYFNRPHPFRRLKIRLSIAAAAAACVWVLSQAAVGNKDLFSPGKVSSPHALLENKCGACHVGVRNAAFSHAVTDHACEACHTGPIHHQNQIFEGHAGAQPSCASCHGEHRGRTARLAMVMNDRCTQCHSALQAVLSIAPPDAARRPAAGYVRTITSFGGDHPEFQVIRDKQKENAAIKLNHKKHLRSDLPGANGRPVQMQCGDCHHVKDNGTTMMPIDYARDCRSCHALGFDERVREEAPHEDPAIVDAFVRIAFSKYAGKNPGQWKQNVDWHPAKNLAELRLMVDEAPRNLPEWLERQVLASNKLLFEKKCLECHVIQSPSGAALPAIAKTQIPGAWLGHSRFAHSPHRQLKCVSCHANAPTSSATADVLLPSRSDCLQCHNAAGVSDTCVTCHIYHDKSRPAI